MSQSNFQQFAYPESEKILAYSDPDSTFWYLIHADGLPWDSVIDPQSAAYCHMSKDVQLVALAKLFQNKIINFDVGTADIQQIYIIYSASIRAQTATTL